MPGTPTPRFAIPTLAATDAINQGSSTISAALNAIDTAMAGYSQGALAARPAAGTAGRFYRATNVTGGLYFDDGSVWWSVLLPGPWTALSVAANVSTGSPAPMYRTEGSDVVRLRGQITATAGVAKNVAWATLPVGFRPGQSYNTLALYNTLPNGSIDLYIPTSGVLQSNHTNLNTADTVSLDGISFSTTP